MEKRIPRIVLTGGPAAGKTTLVSRILKEFKSEDGWKVLTIPETATELISGFGFGPFPNCMSMEDFQYYVIDDQLHKERLALRAAQAVPEEKVLILYDRAVLDDKAYVTDEVFAQVLGRFGLTEEQVLTHYDAVLHLVSCAKGAEYAFNYGNAARYESIEDARELDDRTLRAWQGHHALYVIDNSVDFEDKINRALAQICRVLGESAPEPGKRKYLVRMPDRGALTKAYGALPIEMMQTYLLSSDPDLERRIRQQSSFDEQLFFYTTKRVGEDGTRWVTERPISGKEYVTYLMEADLSLHSVRKLKYRFTYRDHRMELDVYPFSKDRAILFVYGSEPFALPPEIEVLQDVTGDPAYKNRALAETQRL